MARRSAMNQRYQKDAKVGSTRKSASSSKPKREAGSYTAASTKKAPEKKKQSFFSPLPTSPEIKKWRRVWYGLLALAVVSYALTLYAQKINNEILLTIALAVELGAVAVAVGLDLVVIRKLRNQVMADLKAGKKGGAKSAEKSVDKSAPKSDKKELSKDAGKDPS
jgi:hypothetical protein